MKIILLCLSLCLMSLSAIAIAESEELKERSILERRQAKAIENQDINAKAAEALKNKSKQQRQEQVEKIDKRGLRYQYDEE